MPAKKKTTRKKTSDKITIKGVVITASEAFSQLLLQFDYLSRGVDRNEKNISDLKQTMNEHQADCVMNKDKLNRLIKSTDEAHHRREQEIRERKADAKKMRWLIITSMATIVTAVISGVILHLMTK